MGFLYITGNKHGCGKTALATALALLLSQQGKKVALFKPFSTGPDQESAVADHHFFRQLLGNNPSPEGWPTTLPSEASFTGSSAFGMFQETAFALDASHDTVIIEGLDSLDPEAPLGRGSSELATSLGAQVVGVVRYAPDLQARDLARAAELYPHSLAGTVLNGIPRYRGHSTQTRLLSKAQAPVPLWGAIPEDRMLLAPSVAEIERHLKGEFLVGKEKAGELVHSFMVGGWFLDNGTYVFERRTHKAVIVRADRPDLHMAAMETSTVCLILTGGQSPIQYVLHEAEQRGVAVILVSEGTVRTMERLASLAPQVTVRNPRKAQRFAELLKEHCNREALSMSLGIVA